MNDFPTHPPDPRDEELERQLANLLAGMEDTPNQETPPNLSPEAQERLHHAQACLRLLKKTRSGTHALPPKPAKADTTVASSVEEQQLLHCILQELHLRQTLGASLVLQEYVDKYPQYAHQLQAAIETPPLDRSAAPTPMDGSAPRRGEPTFQSLPNTGMLSLPKLQLPDYRLIQEIGRGGMGVVFKAWQISLKRAVALKMILAGGFATPEMRQRFRTEAEAVAALQHPNIVQIHDVGELDGCDYFAMEFVNGVSLDRFGNGHPQLPREAAKLLLTLALAIHAAHRQGIIHRDLKPANILLMEQGSPAKLDRSSGHYRPMAEQPRLSAFLPKITDFGLAKRLDQTEPITSTGQAVGTPSYMAPEQAREQKKIGPATDVYALGAILYELLTGRPPFRAPTPVETVLQMLETETVPPRKLQPQVPRDLETICLKCLAKEPGKRYASAADLAADLHRFLQGEPIHARPTSRLERTWKWAQRRPAVAALLTVSCLAIFSLLAVWLWFTAHLQDALTTAQKNETKARQQQQRAEDEKQRADENLEQSLTAVDKMLAHVGAERLARFPQMAETRKLILEDALKLQEELLQKQSANPAARYETARTAQRVGDIHGQLGRVKEAEKAYRQALELFQQLEAKAPQTPKYRREKARTLLRQGSLLVRQGQYTAGEKCYAEALALVEILRKEEPTEDVHFQFHATICSSLGWICMNTNRGESGLSWFAKGLPPFEELAKKYPKDVSHQDNLAQHLFNYGRTQVSMGYVEQGETLMRRSVSLLDEAVKGHPDDANLARSLAFKCLSLGNLLMQKEAFAEAEKQIRRGTGVYERQAREHPTAHEVQLEWAYALQMTGTLAEEQQQWSDALKVHRQALALSEKLYGLDPAHSGFQEMIGTNLNHVARCERELSKPGQALPLAERSVAHWRKVVSARGPIRQYQWELGTALWEAGLGYEALGRHKEALAAFDEALPLVREDKNALVHMARAATLISLGDHAQAAATARAVARATTRRLLVRFSCARALCCAAKIAGNDPKLDASKRERVVKACLDDALRILREVNGKGLFKQTPKLADELRTLSDFEPLRHRPEFTGLLAEVEKQARKDAGS